ncbi:MAG: 5'-deoxynucleotidase [Oscillospiraceae bacterium]|nr:5'-deoxynucleotidase [Oscillospiraceae bacterium]
MQDQFYSMLSRMKLINRWGLMRNTRNENISEHSLETAMLAHCLAVIHNTYFGGNVNAERCALLGVFHDVTEIITGDLPTPVKYYNPEIRTAYKEVEDTAKKQLISMLPEEMRGEFRPLLSPEEDCSEEELELWRFVKAADKLSALIKCIEERMTGNSDFLSAEKASAEAVKAMKMPEADYFMEHFLPSYDNTLDEQAQRA